MKVLRLLLGDQLNIKHSWFKNTDRDVLYCLFEMKQETDYVKHHIQKLIGFFAAMRQFHSDLTNMGHQVSYFKINDKENTHNLVDNLKHLIQQYNIERFEYIYPDEFRLDLQLSEFCGSIAIKTNVVSAEHFYTDRDELATFFKGKKQFIMESFYRYMRKKHDILMYANQPEGGKWNFDASNRKKWNGSTLIPKEIEFNNDITEVVEDIKKANIKTIGQCNDNLFSFPIYRSQALEQLKYFCEHLLVSFGDYQDAMHTSEKYLFHSRLSFAMNLKLISAKDVVKTVINYHSIHKNNIHISQAEGFIRQIIGWREYMRGMYWALMPAFKEENSLQNTNTLAHFFWTGNTKMNCLKHCINNSLENSYAHHIQRLMITGNYALLTQTNPDDVDAWYLGIYIDAVEWVQITNTRGMSQFADSGKIATKPYVSSASYINKMGDYCTNCHYNKNKKFEDDACPFNSLYWNFLDDKRPFLQTNFRMRMMYKLLDKMDKTELQKIKLKAKHIIEHQNEY